MHVHRQGGRSGGGWVGRRWLAYGHDGSARVDKDGNVRYFDTEAEAERANQLDVLKTIREYLQEKRRGR